ncbi:unnamed protein product [Rhodiola kirilowii]
MIETLVTVEGSVSDLREQNKIIVEDDMNKNVVDEALMGSFGSDNGDIDGKGSNKNTERNERLESDEEMKKETRDVKKATFKITTNESVVETSNGCLGLSNDSCKKVVYSRSQLEAFRFVGVKEQKEKWRGIYNDLGPDLSSEYDSLANSVNKKHVPPNSKSQRQPSGRKEKTNMPKSNHVMEVDICSSSRSQDWTEDRFTGLDEEFSQDSDSDEEYDGILKPAFHVDGEPNFDSGPPEDGMEYLRRARWEASQIPKVKVAKLDRNKVNKNQSDYMPKIPDIAKCPDHLLPSKEWEELFLAKFEKLRLALSSAQPSSFCSSDASAGNPTLSAILGMEPVTRVSMLKQHITLFTSSNTLSHDNCVWLFSLCASVETPLDADTCASIRSLLRKCASLRAEKMETDEEVANNVVAVPGKEQDKAFQPRISTPKQPDVAPTQAPRLGNSEQGSKNIEFEERLEAVRRLALEKKKVDGQNSYGPIDYDAPVEPKQNTVGIGAQVGLGVGIIIFGLIFALGDFLPSTSVTEETPKTNVDLPKEQRLALEVRLQQFEAALLSSPKDSTALEGAAVTLAELGDYSRAASYLEDFVKEKPSDPEALRLLGEVKFELKDYAGSVAAYRGAAEASKTLDLEIIRGLTNSLLADKKPAEAVNFLLGCRERVNKEMLADSIDNAVGTETQSVDSIQVELLLGKAYSDWGHISDAVSVYDGLIASHPNDFRGYLAKGIILKENGNAGAAERMFIQARFFAPDKAKGLVNRFAGR